MNKNEVKIMDLIDQYVNIMELISKKADKWGVRSNDLFRMIEFTRQSMINQKVSINIKKPETLVIAIHLDGIKCNVRKYCIKNGLNPELTIPEIEKVAKRRFELISNSQNVIIASIG